MQLSKNTKIGLTIFLVLFIIAVVTIIILSLVKKQSSSKGDDSKPDSILSSSNIREGKYTLSYTDLIRNRGYDKLIKRKVPTEFTIVKDENGEKVVYSGMAGTEVTFESPSIIKVNGQELKADPSRVRYSATGNGISGYRYSYTVEDLPEGTISPSNIRPGTYTISFPESVVNQGHDVLVTSRDHGNMPTQFTIEYDENGKQVIYSSDNIDVTFDDSIMTVKGKKLMATGVPIVRYNAIDKISGYSYSYIVSQT